MSILDALVRREHAAHSKESPEERKKRLIREGKATEEDFPKDSPISTPVLDPSWANYAKAKADEDERKKKKPKTKAARALSKSDDPDEFVIAQPPVQISGTN